MKRSFDILFAVFAIVILFLPLILLSFLVFCFHGRPVIFSQRRVGLNSRIFRIYKFRTMTNERDQFGFLLPESQRITLFGSLLRSTSLDELPELWNILRGDMSFVGPRPLLVDYLPLYTSSQARRHDVRPGLTGWAQINGRNSLSWEQRFILDVWYVDHKSIALDFYILIKTVWTVFVREGVNASASVTMQPFTGSTTDQHSR